MSHISIHSIKKNFKHTSILKSVSIEIKDQEFCVLLGPSGCGKTTLLRIIAGLETESEGVIKIGNKQVNGLSPGKRKIAMVFQNYAVFPHMTIGQNIGFGLRMAKQPSSTVEKQVRRCAELMHIEHLLDRYAGQLSGGQRQRVAVARALATSPDVLLMDEPLSNLDALLRLEMRTELKALLKETKTTTIYVTHDQVEAMSLADRIAVMHAGEIVQYAPPMEVYDQPETEFVGRFIGNPPMNFLPLHIAQKLGGGSAPQNATSAGIRPEHFIAHDSAVSLKTKVIEALGEKQQLNGEIEQIPVRITLPNHYRVSAAESLPLKVIPQNIRWYDSNGNLIRN
jgi:multiple sugar transport system ATP-binding protein